MNLPGWEDRDLRVLRVVVEYCEAHSGYAEVHHVRSHSDVSDLTQSEIRKAFSALAYEEPRLFANFAHDGGGVVFMLRQPTGEARRRLGLWPKPEDRLEQIGLLLEALAARTAVAEEKEALSKTAKVVRGAGSLSGQFITGLASGMTGNAIMGGS